MHLKILPVTALAVVSLALPAAATAATTAGAHSADHGVTTQLTGHAATPTDVGAQLRALRATSPVAGPEAGSDAEQLRADRDRIQQALPRTVASATTPTTVPVITSPADGSTVSGVSSITATTTAPVVLFATANHLTFVQSSGGDVSTVFDTYGEPDGAQTLQAYDCATTTDCSGVGASVNVTVDNGPVTLTQPADGATVGGSFVAGATSSGGRISFRVDSIEVAAVSAPPYLATIDTSALSVGPHELQAVRCAYAGTSCSAGSAPITFTVARVTPVVTSATPSPFSPNGDGHVDTTNIGYRLDSNQKVTWRVTSRDGKTVRGPIRLGAVSAGRHSLTFNGKTNSGKYLTSGGYVVRLDTSQTFNGVTVTGDAEHAVLVDLKAPQASGVHASLSTFYPARDRYKDTTTVTVHTSEPTRSAQLRVLNGAGHKVATVPAQSISGRTLHLTWNGRAGARVLPAGRYSYQVVLTDRVWNTRVSRKYPVVISDKRLIRHSGTQTIGNLKQNHSDALIGDCSAVVYPARPGHDWTGSLSYLSNYDICQFPSDTDLLAVTQHQIALPSAVRYGTARVTTYGGRSVAGFPDIGVVLYENKSGDITSKGGVLKAADGWHAGSQVSAADFAQGRKFQWWAGTTDSNFYDIRSFRVSYTYYLLQ